MADDLEARIAQLSEEIRRYPTPIARCDVQLSALLEHRAKLLSQRECSAASGCSPDTVWINDGGFNAA